MKVRGAAGRHRPADQKIAQIMFRSLKTFISALIEHDRQAPAVSKLQLASSIAHACSDRS